MDIIDTIVDLDSKAIHMLDCGHFAGQFGSFCKVPPAGYSDEGYGLEWAFIDCAECGQQEIRAY
jgi:hypothetical protein